MSPLEQAREAAKRVQDAIQAELSQARTQRILIRKLDVQGLFERARGRGEFNLRLAQLQEALSDGLRASAAWLGLERVNVDALHAVGGDAALALALALSELRASAQALQEIDAMNQTLTRRALSCVRGFLGAVAPRASGYDRYGGLSKDGAGALTRRVA
jgi:hypothetical protein